MVETRPQLEIYADDVQCSHGAAIGRLDENAMFYLRQRGLDRSGRARDAHVGVCERGARRRSPTRPFGPRSPTTLRHRIAGAATVEEARR